MKISPAPCDVLIRGGTIVTQDKERTCLESSAIAVRNGKIFAMGPDDVICAAHTAPVVHDLRHCLVMPGLVNGHTHAAMTYLRGLADDLPLMEWLNNHIFPVEKHLTADLVEFGTMLACAEMLKTGTTAFSDMYILEDALFRAVADIGMRVLAGEGIFDFPGVAAAGPDQALEIVRAQAKSCMGHDRLFVSVCPHAVYTTSIRTLEKCAELAQQLRLPVHIHLAETEAENHISQEKHGLRPLEVCRKAGLLDCTGTLAHGVYLDEDELDVLKGTQLTVVHNPKSNMKLASGVAPVSSMLRKGMLPGLGTDGAASNNSLNMFSEMSACALLHKVHSLDATAVSAQNALDMATLGSTAAMGRKDFGRLEVGGPADIVALDLTSPNMQPGYDPVSDIVYAASGHEVMMTMVAGKILYMDGEFATIDHSSLTREMYSVKKFVRSLL